MIECFTKDFNVQCLSFNQLQLNRCLAHAKGVCLRLVVLGRVLARQIVNSARRG